MWFLWFLKPYFDSKFLIRFMLSFMISKSLFTYFPSLTYPQLFWQGKCFFLLSPWHLTHPCPFCDDSLFQNFPCNYYFWWFLYEIFIDKLFFSTLFGGINIINRENCQRSPEKISTETNVFYMIKLDDSTKEPSVQDVEFVKCVFNGLPQMKKHIM